MAQDKSDVETDTGRQGKPTDPATEPYGSVLGIIDSDPEKKLPKAAKDKGGHPSGINVRPGTTGLEDLSENGGYTSDMGAGGEGVDIQGQPEEPDEE